MAKAKANGINKKLLQELVDLGLRPDDLDAIKELVAQRRRQEAEQRVSAILQAAAEQAIAYLEKHISDEDKDSLTQLALTIRLDKDGNWQWSTTRRRRMSSGSNKANGNGKRAIEVEVEPGKWVRFESSKAACEALGLEIDKWGPANTLRKHNIPRRWVD